MPVNNPAQGDYPESQFAYGFQIRCQRKVIILRVGIFDYVNAVISKDRDFQFKALWRDDKGVILYPFEMV